MKPLFVFLSVAGLFFVFRAGIDLYDILWSTRSQIAGAGFGAEDCNSIYRSHQFKDPVLHREFIRLCEQRRDLSERWFLFESIKSWVAALWICETVHCSEYALPLLDSMLGGFRYGVFFVIVIVMLFVYYSIPLLMQLMFERLRGKQQPMYYHPQYAIPMGEGYGIQPHREIAYGHPHKNKLL